MAYREEAKYGKCEVGESIPYVLKPTKIWGKVSTGNKTSYVDRVRLKFTLKAGRAKGERDNKWKDERTNKLKI